MALTFVTSSDTDWSTSGTWDGAAMWKEVTVPVLTGDIIVAGGVNEGGSGTGTTDIATTAGSTTAWDFDASSTSTSDVGLVRGYAEATADGNVTIRVRMAVNSSISTMGAAALVFRGGSGAGVRNTTPTATRTASLDVQANSAVVTFGGDWDAGTAATGVTPVGGTVIESSTISGRYTTHVAYWTSQAAGTRSYGATGGSGSDWRTFAIEILEEASGPTEQALTLPLLTDADTLLPPTVTGTSLLTAPTLVGQGSIAVQTGTAALAPVLPAHQAGDVLVAVVAHWLPNTTSAAALQAAPSGWTKAAGDSLYGPNYDGEWALFWRRATSSAEANPSFARQAAWDSGTDGLRAARCYVIRGCDPNGDPWDDIQQSALFSTANGAIPAVNVAGSNRLVMQFLIASDDNGVGAGIGGWTAGTRVASTTGTDAEFQTYRQDDVASPTSSVASTVLARTAGRYLFVGISFKPDPTQSLTLPLLTDTELLFAPSVAPGTVALTLPSLSNTNTLTPPSVAQDLPGQAITLPALVGVTTLHSPSVAPGAVGLVLPALTDVDTLRAPTITPGSVALVVPLLSDADSLFAPSVGLGGAPSQPLVLPLIVDGDTLYTPSVVPGTVALVVPHFQGASTLITPTLTPGSVGLVIPRITDADTLHVPSVYLTQALVLPRVVGASVLRAPTVTPGAVGLMLPTLAGLSQLTPPGLAVGTVGLVLPHLPGQVVLLPPELYQTAPVGSLRYFHNGVWLRVTTAVWDGSQWVVTRPKAYDGSVWRELR